MRVIKVRKLNNQGSTFILSLLVIVFLTTLSLALAGASVNNMMMKSIDRGSKKTFYTSESLLDEIRAGIGYSSMDNLAQAYETVLTQLVDNSTGISSVVDNNTANTNLKAAYMENVLNTLTGGYMKFETNNYVTTETMSSMDVTNVKREVNEYISSFIQGTEYDADMARITSIGDIRAYKDSEAEYDWIIIIKDVAVNFKEKKGEEIYFSNITADLEIAYPNMVIDFTSTNRLTDFINYTLIADGSVVVAGKTVEVNSSVYAGDLIDIAPSREDDTIGSNVTFKSLTDANINVVCGGDSGELSGTIRVGGSTMVPSEAHFIGTNIWCTNIATRRMLGEGAGARDATAGAVISIDDMCNTYVKDDLSVDAQKSNISLKGEYFGYMYEGSDNSLGHVASSAIIVNGKNSKLTIGARRLLVGGRAYIDVTGTSSGSYLTGESLGLKGDQEVYLVPTQFLGINYGTGLTNPMSKTVWADLVSKNGTPGIGGNIKICEVPSSYFAKPYLSDAAPYTTRVVDGDKVFVYWNFKDKTSATKYMKDVLNGADAELKKTLERYTKNLLGGSDSVINVLTDSSNIDATGIFMESSGGVPGSTVATGSMPEDIFNKNSTDLQERYKVLTHLLADIPWNSGASRYYVVSAETALEQNRGFLVTGNELIQTSIISNIIDMSLLSVGNEYNPEGNYIAYGPPTQNYTKMIVNGDCDIDEEVYGGVIIATGNVTLNNDFYGLIIAGGNIDIRNDAVIYTNPNMVEEFIMGKEMFEDEEVEAEDVPFKQYFIAYKSSAVEEDSREEVKIESINYKDLVNFNNWRKYEDK